jgi:hypothetical protein
MIAKAQMNPEIPVTTAGKHDDGDTEESAKLRPCLRCNEPFTSGWSGERICRRCKDSIAWRNNEPFRQRRTLGAKRSLR